MLWAPLWGALMTLSLYASLQLSVAGLTFHLPALAVLFFAGGTLAFPLAVLAMRFLAAGKPAETRFAAALLCLGGLTVVLTALIFAIVYRNFYAQWHGEVFTRIWAAQLVVTIAAALYQFAVIGLRAYLPLGLVFLVAASLWLAKTTR